MTNPLYKCPECGWVGTKDEMTSDYDEEWDGEEETCYGAIFNCPNSDCSFVFGVYAPDGNCLVDEGDRP